MCNRTFWLAACMLGLLLTMSSHLLAQEAAAKRESQWALVHGTIYLSPSEEPIKNGVVLIQGNTIAAVGREDSIRLPADIEKLDCTGRTVTAGFWNSHVHFIQRKWANAQEIPPAELDLQMQDMITRWGFTSVFDTGSAWENTKRLRDRIES